MKTVLMIGLGGALGSILRYGIGFWLNGVVGLFPLGTFAVNAVGSVLLGFIFSLLESNVMSHYAYGILAIGFCGGFTTFSTFSLESYSLWKDKHVVEAFLYMLSSFIIGPTMIAVGYACGKLFK